MLYLAIAEEEGPGKPILESKHERGYPTLDAPDDLEIYGKFGLSAYMQHALLIIAQEDREQHALLTIKDLVKLLKNSYRMIKRDIKAIRNKGFYVPIRGVVRHWSVIA